MSFFPLLVLKTPPVRGRDPRILRGFGKGVSYLGINTCQHGGRTQPEIPIASGDKAAQRRKIAELMDVVGRADRQ